MLGFLSKSLEILHRSRLALPLPFRQSALCTKCHNDQGRHETMDRAHPFHIHALSQADSAYAENRDSADPLQLVITCHYVARVETNWTCQQVDSLDHS